MPADAPPLLLEPFDLPADMVVPLPFDLSLDIVALWPFEPLDLSLDMLAEPVVVDLLWPPPVCVPFEPSLDPPLVCCFDDELAFSPPFEGAADCVAAAPPPLPLSLPLPSPLPLPPPPPISWSWWLEGASLRCAVAAPVLALSDLPCESAASAGEDLASISSVPAIRIASATTNLRSN